jgi:type IV secretion system protein TrbC
MKLSSTFKWFMFCFLSCACLSVMATSLPWETPLQSLAQSLTGKTAKAIAMIGLFVAGGLLVFGGELSDFGRRITWMCLAISVMLAGTSFLDMFSTSTSAALIF